MRTLQNPGSLARIIGAIQGQRGPKLTPAQKEKRAAAHKLRVEGGDNPNRFQQAVRNSRKKGETFRQSARRLGGSGDTFGGS